MDIRCCPETSRDANGSTEITELRFFLTQLVIILCRIVLKLRRSDSVCFLSPKTGLFLLFKGGGI